MKKKLNCVLLVDDNESDNFLHKRVIEKSGITDHIEIVLNGKEAIERLTAKVKLGKAAGTYRQPDLIFLDINMPVMDGWEFLEEYRKLEDAQKGKVILIMLTTSLNPADISKAKKTLGTGYFKYKPLTLELLNEIMKQHFPEYLDA